MFPFISEVLDFFDFFSGNHFIHSDHDNYGNQMLVIVSLTLHVLTNQAIPLLCLPGRSHSFAVHISHVQTKCVLSEVNLVT